MPGQLGGDGLAPDGCQLAVVGSGPMRRAQIALAVGEQAVADLAAGGQLNPAASTRAAQEQLPAVGAPTNEVREPRLRQPGADVHLADVAACLSAPGRGVRGRYRTPAEPGRWPGRMRAWQA
jgi:hypothetical protein